MSLVVQMLAQARLAPALQPTNGAPARTRAAIGASSPRRRGTRRNNRASSQHSPHSPVPHEIASVLYIASIAAALVRCRRRITGLTNDALAEGFRWELSQPWLDAPTRALTEESLLFLNTQAGERA